MGFVAPPKKTGSGVLCPQGTYVARCIRVVDFGTQIEQFQGKPPREVPKIAFTFELPTKKHVFDETKGEEPFTLTAKYNVTSNRDKGKLLPMIDAWLGSPVPDEVIAEKRLRYDKMLNRPAMITVLHKDKETGKSAVITNITALPEGVTCPPQILPQYTYTVDSGKENPFTVWHYEKLENGKPVAKQMLFKDMPEWMQEICNQCLEWRPRHEEAGPTGGDDQGGGSENNPW